MLVVLAGGGTGGHIYPGVAVGRALETLDASIAVEFWGSGRPVETEIFRKEGVSHRCLSCQPLPVSPLGAPRFLWSLVRGYFQARQLLRREKASAVVGLGGFSSYAPVRAAIALGLPVFLLEQNVIPGAANVRLAQKATLLCASWPETKQYFAGRIRLEVTGNPLRRALVEAAAAYTYSPRAGVLVLGGSTGAVGVNSLVIDALKNLGVAHRPITHQTGSQDLERVRSAYETAGLRADVRSYIDDMPAAYAAASVVIARAGATTLAELALFGLPAILIPYPYHKDQHQLANARIFANVGAARIIEEKKNTGAGLADVLGTLVGDEAALLKAHAAAGSLARPEAAETVASRILCALDTARPEAAKTPTERK